MTLFGALASACATPRQAGLYESPQLALESLAVDFAPGDEGTVTVGLSVQNDEDRPWEAQAISLDLSLNGRWFASGTSQVKQNLPARALTQVTVRLPIAFRREGRRAENTFVSFAVRGELAVLAGSKERDLRFFGRKRLEVRNAPAFAHEDLR